MRGRRTQGAATLPMRDGQFADALASAKAWFLSVTSPAANGRIQPERVFEGRWAKSAIGRLPEVTNGRFVEAKLEKPALSIGQLWRSPTGGFGSKG